MPRTLHFSLLGLATLFSVSLHAQTTVLPFSSSAGPAIITNYATTGPGLTNSSLFESRLSQPLGVPTVSAGASNFALTPTSSLDQGLLPSTGAVDTDAGLAAPTARAGSRLVPIPARSDVNGPFYAEEPTYTFPGLVARFAGEWVGSEYLYNMPADIGVVVEIVTSDQFPIHIDRQRIKDAVAEIFTDANINPVARAIGDQPPLPFFHVLVFVQNAEEGTCAYVAGRLFEGVRLLRLDYALPGTQQAITWEHQDLLVDSLNRIESEILASAQATAKTFVDRIAFFARQKLEQEEMMRLRCTNFGVRQPVVGVPGSVTGLPQRKIPAAHGGTASIGPAGRLGGAPKALPSGGTNLK